MDIELAKTFLEIVSAGSFIRASERLHITQTAVTARVRSLEQELGCRLFIRNRAGARLTSEGEIFLTHATELVNTWNHAKRSVALPKGLQSRLRLGTETSLWNPLFVHWISWIQDQLPEAAVDTQVVAPDRLINAIERGQLDAAIIHTPNYYAGMAVELLLEEKLIRVQSPIKPAPDLFVNWGSEFERQYMAVASSPSQCPFSFDLGPLALQVMLQTGGNGWFRSRVVEPYLKTGRLLRVQGAPEFTYPVYLTHRSDTTKPMLARALEGVRDIAELNVPWLL